MYVGLLRGQVRHPQSLEGGAPFKQLILGAIANLFPTVDDYYSIGIFNGRKPVGDDDLGKRTFEFLQH